ncbi:MAG: hypothetical protein ABIH52_04085 [Candidatus Aenigmatarchaeota archaeon]
MVFARTKLVMEDNCYAEEPGTITMKYVGPNVTTIYDKLYESMKLLFRVSDADIQETDYSWGKGKDSDKFKVRWWIHKDMDLFTYLFVRIDLSGQGNEKTGNATIGVRGLLRTEYPQDTIWQRSLFYEMFRTLWHRAIYHKKREDYAIECRHITMILQKRMIEYFKELRGSSNGGETVDKG